MVWLLMIQRVHTIEWNWNVLVLWPWNSYKTMWDTLTFNFQKMSKFLTYSVIVKLKLHGCTWSASQIISGLSYLLLLNLTTIT